jgi:hypothetical protein
MSTGVFCFYFLRISWSLFRSFSPVSHTGRGVGDGGDDVWDGMGIEYGCSLLCLRSAA